MKIFLKLFQKKLKSFNSGDTLFYFLTLLLTLVLFSKILFLESGIFANIVYFQSQICECNHSSKNEVHATESANQDNALFEKAIFHLERELVNDLPNCHTMKNSEVHKCSCSKKKNTWNTIHTQLMNPSFVSLNSFFLPLYLESSSAFAGDSKNLLKGYSHILDKPPRN